MEFLQSLMSVLPGVKYLPYIIVLLIFVMIAYAAHRAKDCNFNVFDLLMDPATGKASVTKFWQNAGAGTATIAIIQMANNHTLTDTTLAVYMAALGISEGFSKYIGAKYLSNNQTPPVQ